LLIRTKVFSTLDKLILEPLLSHGIYLNIFFIDFLGRRDSIPLAAYICSSDPALKFDQKYLHLCSEDEQRFCRVGTACD